MSSRGKTPKLSIFQIHERGDASCINSPSLLTPLASSLIPFSTSEKMQPSSSHNSETLRAFKVLKSSAYLLLRKALVDSREYVRSADASTM
jgi:hypothetical protein